MLRVLMPARTSATGCRLHRSYCVTQPSRDMKIDEAAVGRELRPAVQREAGRETGQRLEAVAVEDRDVVIAGLDHDEQVQRVGLEARPVRQGSACGIRLTRVPRSPPSPQCGTGGSGVRDVGGQGRDLVA